MVMCVAGVDGAAEEGLCAHTERGRSDISSRENEKRLIDAPVFAIHEYQLDEACATRMSAMR
jgi:hypothetical protein